MSKTSRKEVYVKMSGFYLPRIRLAHVLRGLAAVPIVAKVSGNALLRHVDSVWLMCQPRRASGQTNPSVAGELETRAIWHHRERWSSLCYFQSGESYARCTCISNYPLSHVALLKTGCCKSSQPATRRPFHIFVHYRSSRSASIANSQKRLKPTVDRELAPSPWTFPRNMVRLREIPRTATFAWSPDASKPLVATGTRAGAVTDDFSDERRLELWDLDLDNHDQGLELQPVASITTSSRYELWDTAWKLAY
jgi:hypothetical protein